MAKYPINAQDPYVDPVSGVLRTRLGITDQGELDKVEATFAAVRSYEPVSYTHLTLPTKA